MIVQKFKNNDAGSKFGPLKKCSNNSNHPLAIRDVQRQASVARNSMEFIMFSKTGINILHWHILSYSHNMLSYIYQKIECIILYLIYY